jgi:hypothetical protein
MGKPEQKETPVTREWKPFLGRAALLAAASIIPFLPGTGGPFMFDDIHTIVNNPAIESIDIPLFFSDPTAFSTKAGNWPYRPFVLVANALQLKMFGFDHEFWHLFQIIVHFLNSLLVMAVAGRVFGLKRGALIAGLLFAAAPLQTQAVNYISARSMVMACAPVLFAVLSITTAAGAKESTRALWWGVACVISAAVAFFTADGALALIVFLPLALFASGADYRNPRLWAIIAGVLAAAALFIILRSLLIPGPFLGPHPRVAPPYTPVENAFLQLRYPWLMARLFAMPAHLSLLHHAFVPASILDHRVLLPLIGFAAAVSGAAVFRGQRPLIAGIGWYFLALAPALIVPLNIAWAEHRTYLALPGLAIAAGYVLERFVSSLDPEKRVRSIKPARACIGAIMVLFFLTTFHRSGLWSSPLSLYGDAAKKAPLYDVPWSFLANEKRISLENRKALLYLDRAIALNPNFADAHGSRSDIMVKLGRYREAVESARRATELAPENGTYWNNLATALMFMERWADAEQVMRTALEKTPTYDPNRRIVEKNWSMLQRKIRESKQ